MAQGPTPLLSEISAPSEIMDAARLNCAERAEARGEKELAASFLEGGQDRGWALRHEVAKLLAESGHRDA